MSRIFSVPKLLGLTGLAILTLLPIGIQSIPAAAATASPDSIRAAGSTDAITGQYIAVLKKNDSLDKNAVTSLAHSLSAKYGGRAEIVYSAALQGFSVAMNEQQARRLAADSAVSFVEQDQVVASLPVTVEQGNPAQTGPYSWGLDRINQRNLPLDNSSSSMSASNVTAYVIDSGIRATHEDFGGRVQSGYDFVDNDPVAFETCNGHGTHVAGTLGGAKYGVAKDVKMVAVRVTNCSGSGTTSQLVAGVDWVTANAVKPAVANMSNGGPASDVKDAAVTNSLASGITYTVSAGNGQTDACTRSPARIPGVLTVGATNIADNRAHFSNFGPCVDIFAPGMNIASAWVDNDSDFSILHGTSMAAPHVAGAAALALSHNPEATPSEIADLLVNNATVGVVGDPGVGSPNRLLYSVLPPSVEN